MKKLKQYQQIGLQLTEFNVNNYPNGTYSVVLEIDGEIPASQHLLILR